MTLHSQAKSLLRYQSIGITCIVLAIIAGIFSYFLLKDNSNHKHRLQTLDFEVREAHKRRIQLEVKNASDYIIYMNSQAENQLKRQSKAAVEKAHIIASSIYRQQKDILSPEKIKRLIIETLRDIRFFNGRGYYFIDGLDSLVHMLPPFPKLEGSYFFDIPNTTTNFQLILDSLDNPQKAGYSRYQWYSPARPKQLSEKISYAKVFEPFDWLIGAGDYLSGFEQDLRLDALERLSKLKLNSQANITILDTSGLLISNFQQHNLFTSNQALNIILSNEIISFAQQGGGFIDFSKLLNTPLKDNNQLAYIETIEPLNWIVIADISPGKINKIIATQSSQIELQSREDLQVLMIVLAITALITLLIIYLYNVWFQRLFKTYQNSLDLKQQEILLNNQKLKLASRVFESTSDAIVVTNTKLKIIVANPACIKITGYQAEEIIDKNAKFLCSDHQDDYFYKEVFQQLHQQGHWQGEFWNKHKNGKVYPIWLSISTFIDTKHRILNYIAIFSDISELKKTEKRLTYLADYDPLTQLAKRHILADRVDEIIKYSELNHQQQFALMLIDLDRFKNINDTLGHNIGDQVLQHIAKRLSANIRASDIIGRLSGDEFIILVNHNKAYSAASRLASRIIIDLAEPIKIADHDLVVTPSIGIAAFPDDGINFDSLLKNADAALNHAKSQGRNNYQFFTDDMHQRASEKLSLERGLRLGLSKQQFELHYQPQFDLATNELVGCEALLRWNCPKLNSPSPDKFIPIAEDTGLILPIGQWVLDTACRQAKHWQEQGYKAIPIAVNVSSYQFTKNIVSSIQHSLDTANLDPSLLVIEITESALMQDPEFTQNALLELRALGLKIALDDFGTGYSSLAYLKRFPIDKLKIDKTFITGLPDDQDDLVITRSILDVANNLNMTTIAEGVETTAQQQLLSELGCQQMQGFLKGRPVAAKQFALQHLVSECLDPKVSR
ncbi:MAG: hypothetical protein OFPII_24440 [Osedax symbiont Rs1]|nr:MAG: hypothetical protein OFPII_24440 [Osedax symbiont Rs1]